MKKEHPHAQVLRWIADGETVDFRCLRDDINWTTISWSSASWLGSLVAGDAYHGYEFRIKPKTITVGDREIEAPVMSGPGVFISETGVALDWLGDHRDHPAYEGMQRRGRVFASIEAARADQEAFIVLLTREPS
ncbi:MAG: hypothetical protein E2581_13505 [Pseudomonas sp.]|uniref:hypothetical protein n=1 Tax=Pseudomonas sp. TaxID=306 RepID=UPI001D8DA53A|nr:hypothetical protein [Pseudomonas sp.]MPS99500.1 hypothetical protein [Pseudomonas sp.]